MPTITGENFWLLTCFPPILDPAIHRLAAAEPQFEEYSIREIVSELVNRREMACLQHWPYQNCLHSWAQLLTAYDKFLHKVNHLPEAFPPPPIDGVEDEDFEIMPLKSCTAVRREAAEMSNCLESFVVKIGSLENYAYKLIRPERASVLLKCDRRQWRIEEAMIKANARAVSPETMKLLRYWIQNYCQN